MQDTHHFAEARRTEHQHGQVVGLAGQLYRGLYDKAECAFRTDHQMAEIVAGGVLDQALVQIKQLALAGDHFQAEDPVAGHAVADHLDAAGIGADIAANIAGAGGGKIHRIEQALLLGKFLQLLGNDAGLHGDGAIERAEIQHLVHPVKGHHHLAIGGHGGGRQPRAATGRHQRDAMLIGQPDNSLHLFGALRQQYSGRCRRPHLGPVHAITLQAVFVGQATGAQQRAEQVGNSGHCLLRKKCRTNRSPVRQDWRDPGRAMVPYAPLFPATGQLFHGQDVF